MVIVSPRICFYEIAVKEWFPGYLQEKFPRLLTIGWTNKVPFFQKSSAVQLVAHTLRQVLDDARTYRYIDFYASAGGLAHIIEQELSSQLSARHSNSSRSTLPEKLGGSSLPAQLVPTDLYHFSGWTKITKHAEIISFIPESVDATCAPSLVKSNGEQKIFQILNLSFHHLDLDDQIASEVVRNSFKTADGIGIFELHGLGLSALISIFQIVVIYLYITPFYLWKSPRHLFFTYVIPLLPLIIFIDGCISCFRSRDSEAVLDLIHKECTSPEDWTIHSGEEQFFWPFGYLSWMIAVKKNTIAKIE